ncbi:MAG TPA: hypothetical protein VFU15_09005 [Bacteroidia bacterium]|nr:hypothetical protein [Bacteroidia bacterium]
MRSLLISLALLLPFAAANADEDSLTVEKAFVHQAGRNNLYVLQLKKGGQYDYTRYTDKKLYHDFGVFRIRHGKISFESKSQKRTFASVGGKTYFMNKKGLYKKRMDEIRDKKSAMKFTDDPSYKKSWSFNPVAGRVMEPDGKPVVKPAAPKTNTDDVATKNKKITDYTEAFYVSMAGRFASPYKALLETDYTGPDTFFKLQNNQPVTWNYDTTKSALQDDFETIIHESTHTFIHTNAGGGNFSYLVQPGLSVNVTPTPAFHSSEIKALAPADATKRIFRYGTYVSDSSVVTANLDGIYGLMDEFTAYENGTRSSVIAAQNAMQQGDTALASSLVSQAGGTYFAYYEFNLFMAWYLHEAKLKHPDDYKAIMANTNLRVAYTLVDAEFAQTITDLKRTSAIVQKKTGTDYLAYNEKTYAAYPKELLVKEKTYLDAFRVKGVTNSNYFTFVN